MRTLELGYHAFETPGLDVPIENFPLSDFLHIRYGFTSSSERPENTAYNDIFQIKTVFGHRDAGNPLTRTDVDQIQSFFHILETGGRMSAVLCDLYDGNSRSISDIRPSISVAIWRLLNLHYELVPLNPAVKTPWRLLTTDPLTVLQCIRAGWGPSTVDIAKEMYSRGMAFKTVGRLPSPLPRPVFYREPSNGADPEGTVRGPEDYLQYEQALATFLRTPHARAAFLEGGLIWRLAKEMSGSALEVEVHSGPSLCCTKFHFFFIT
jgi:hypothetical protein